LIFAVSVGFAQQPPSSTTSVDAQLLEQSKPIERQLSSGETHAYKITLKAGQYLNAAVNQRGVDVVVRVFAPEGEKIADIDSPNGKQGDEPIALEAKATGTFRIEVSSLEKVATVPAGRYEIRINEILSAEQYAARLAEQKQRRDAVIAALKANAIPIKTVEAGNGFEDLKPLKRIFKDVRIVGLGEETHGTREFFQFKHRMLEFLVKEMGFRVFAIEASYSACQNINDYVMGKMDDGAKALDSQGFWTWNTQEVRAMLDWMRAYNASVPAESRVKFAGFDIQGNETAQARLLDYLRRVAPERVSDTEAFFKIDMDTLVFTSFTGKGDAVKDAQAKLKTLKDQYYELLVFLEISAPVLMPKSTQTEYEQMREYARVLAQYIDVYSRPKLNGALRDTYMADNFRRLVDREPAGTRFVVWAHNQHIWTSVQRPSLGTQLRRLYGDEYYAVGFSFNQGSFQAIETPPRDPQQTMPIALTVKPAPIDSVDWFLAQTEAKTGFVDLRSASKNKPIADWIAVAHPMRAIGATFNPKDENRSLVPATLKQSFDGLFFIDTTTRARPNH
jgi:erythromycin esterase